MVKAPLAERWTRLGPSQPKWFIHVPRGGVCVSAFVFVRNRRGDLLLGRPRYDRAWPEKGGLPLWRVREMQRTGEWVLPASHLLMQEIPERAARRIATDFVGISRSRPRWLGVDSSRRATARSAGSGTRRRRVYHWDLCFLYEVRAERVPRPPRAWAELRFFPSSAWKRIDIGRAHADLLHYLK